MNKLNKINYKRALAIFSFALIAVLSSCTGTTVLNTLKLKENTHPVKEYGDSVQAFFKGGILYHGNSVPGQVGFGDFQGEKKIGRACSASYLYLLSFGDSSIQKACDNEKITKVISVQHDITALLGGFFYHRHCTLVVGISDESWKEAKFIHME